MPLVQSASERARILTAIREIATGLDAWQTTEPVHGDRALMRVYLAKDDTVADPDDLAGQALATSLAQLGAHGFGLFGGVAHDAWLVAHLTDDTALADRLEAALIRTLPADTDNFDLIGGLAGLGVLAIERRSAQLATTVVDHLERLAVPRGEGLVFYSPVGGHLDLGMAHGLAGVVAVLARFVEADLERARSARMLDGALAYLSTHLEHAAVDGRLAWCHGELGVALALHAAACARGRDDWRQAALELARRAARKPIDLEDPGLCHGSAGAAHLLHRMHLATGDAELGAAARRWFTHLLDTRRGDAIAGFPAWRFDRGWQPAAELLSGVAGIALALHAAISELAPSWARVFLAELPE